jgi:hypothetical protein
MLQYPVFVDPLVIQGIAGYQIKTPDCAIHACAPQFFFITGDSYIHYLTSAVEQLPDRLPGYLVKDPHYTVRRRRSVQVSTNCNLPDICLTPEVGQQRLPACGFKAYPLSVIRSAIGEFTVTGYIYAIWIFAGTGMPVECNNLI